VTSVFRSATQIFKLLPLNQKHGHKTGVRENKEYVKREQQSGNLM